MFTFTLTYLTNDLCLISFLTKISKNLVLSTVWHKLQLRQEATSRR